MNAINKKETALRKLNSFIIYEFNNKNLRTQEYSATKHLGARASITLMLPCKPPSNYYNNNHKL